MSMLKLLKFRTPQNLTGSKIIQQGMNSIPEGPEEMKLMQKQERGSKESDPLELLFWR